MSRDFALDCDAADILAPYRKQFELPLHANGQPLIYLCGHSLGLAPRAALDYVSEELADWAQLGVAGHHTATRPWIDYAQNFTKGLQHVTGAQANEVVAMNSLTINLHLMMASFYRPVGMRDKVLIEAGAFSSDRHAILGQLSWHKLDPEDTLVELAPRAGEETLRIEDIEAKIEELGSELALVLWPGVQYRTGQAFDCARITARRACAGRHRRVRHGACHRQSAAAAARLGCRFRGVVLVQISERRPRRDRRCFVHERHFGNAPSRLSGWWGHEPQTRFQMLPEFRPATGAAGWAVSNPPIFSAAPLHRLARHVSRRRHRRAAREVRAAHGLHRAAAARARRRRRADHHARRLPKSAAASSACACSGGPRRGRRIFDALGDHGIVCDWREPDIIRIAPAPLYNRFIDIFDFVEELAAALKEIA